MNDQSGAEKNRNQTISELKQLLNNRLETAGQVLAEHAGDVSHHPPQKPNAVAFPESNEEVAKIVQICANYCTPIIPYGIGSAVEGGVVAIHGGICVDTKSMNHILDVSPVNQDAIVQAGVTRMQLNDHLSGNYPGLFFPLDPGADASLGGMSATNASGSAAVKYGMMRDNVLGLTVVTADGNIIRTGGRAKKSSSGYDLTNLFVGSEGTLGIITEITVKLTHLPQSVTAAICPFPDISSAINSTIEMKSAGIPLARMELLDEVQMGAVNRYSKLSYQESPTLFLEFHGTEFDLTEQTEKVGTIAKKHGALDFQWASEQADRDKLWQARYDAYYASLNLKVNGAGFVTDVCVPISQLAECILWTKDLLKETEIPCPLFGHVGDGNYHVVFVIDPENPSELEEVKNFSKQIVDHALKVGGTCSGEHGIGIGKLDALEKEHGQAIHTMRAIKRALDPNNIMNPGKVLEV